MASILRNTIITGPARITFRGQHFWSKGDISLKIINDRFDIETSHFGKVDERISDRRIELEFEPSGRFTNDLAGVLWPYANTTVGASVFAGPVDVADVPLLIHSRDGRELVIRAAALTKMPSLRLGVSQTIMGSVMFTGLIRNNSVPSDPSAYYTEYEVPYPGDDGFTMADILTPSYSAAWGAAEPWSSFLAESGWTVDFELQLAPQKVDGLGTVDMTFQSLAVTAKCVPVGPTQADLLTKLTSPAGLGVSVATEDNLNIFGNGVYVRLSRAALVDGGLTYGNQAKRLAEASWNATRNITAGTADPLFYIGTAAPV
jgi:hypothetical protein